MQYPSATRAGLLWPCAALILASALLCACNDTTYSNRTRANDGATSCDAPLSAVERGQPAHYTSDFVQSVRVDQGWIYLQNTSEGLPGRAGLWRERPGGVLERVTSDADYGSAFNVRDGALLSEARGGGAATRQLVYTELGREPAVILEDFDFVSVNASNNFTGTRRHSVGSETALIEVDHKLTWWDADDGLRILATYNAHSNPTLANGRAAWVGLEQSATVWDSRTPAQPPRKLTPADSPDVRSILLADDYAIWSDERGVIVHDFTTDASERVHSAEGCQLFDANAKQALFTCAGDAGNTSRLWRYTDGGSLMLIREAPLIRHARVSGARSVWAEYSNPAASCESEQGNLMLAVNDATPTPIAPIRDVRSCGALSVESLVLEFDGTVIVWNYAANDRGGSDPYAINHAALEFGPCP